MATRSEAGGNLPPGVGIITESVVKSRPDLVDMVGFTVRVPRSLDIEANDGKGKSYAVVVRDGEVLRPASLLKRMVSMRRVRGTWKPGSPLFVVGGRALDEGVLNRFIASACRAAGQRIASSHWLRVGGASAALAMGVAPDMIKLLGRWDSMVYSQYCRMSREAAMQLSGRVASSRAARI
jgi:hypothetical protein